MNRRDLVVGSITFAGQPLKNLQWDKVTVVKDLDDALSELRAWKRLFKSYAEHIKNIDQTDWIESFRGQLTSAQIKMLEELGYD